MWCGIHLLARQYTLISSLKLLVLSVISVRSFSRALRDKVWELPPSSRESCWLGTVKRTCGCEHHHFTTSTSQHTVCLLLA